MAVYTKQYSNRKGEILFYSAAFSDFTVKLISTYNRRRTTEFGFIQCTVNSTGDDITSIRNVNLNISFQCPLLLNEQTDGRIVGLPFQVTAQEKEPRPIAIQSSNHFKVCMPIHSWCAVPVQLYLFRPSYISVQLTATKRMTAEVWGYVVK